MKHPQHGWTREPMIWDDHGQPLCDTQEEEDQLFEELHKLNPSGVSGDLVLWKD